MEHIRVSSYITSKDVQDSRPWLWLDMEPSASVADVIIDINEESISSAPAVLVPTDISVVVQASGDATATVDKTRLCTALVPLAVSKSKKSKKGSGKKKALPISRLCLAIGAATQWFSNMMWPLFTSVADPLALDREDLESFRESVEKGKKQGGRIGKFFRKHCICS